jgi:hypothetical protein
MQKLFFELIRVALGQQDCVDRAPLTEEWSELYQLSKYHGIAGTCHQGVEKLFEFGLRGPQDVMLDWMEESEETFDADIIELYTPIPMKNALRNRRWQQMLRDHAGQELTTTMHLMSLLVHIHEQFVYRRLPLLLLLDAYRLLQRIDGKFEPDVAAFKSDLRKLGMLHFTQGVMWVLHEVMRMDHRYMPCEPSEKKGRFMLSVIMNGTKGWKESVKKYLY